jgi:adenosylhomocysteine nucleosidase
MTRFATLAIAAWLAVTVPAPPQSGPDKGIGAPGVTDRGALVLRHQGVGAPGVEINPRPIILQGAMQLEIEKLAGRLDTPSVERVGGWTFWRGSVDGYPVIVSKTLKGMSNAAAATVIAVERYHPGAIVNQGTAGGHDPNLHLYDIVVGASAVNIGAFKSRYRAAGRGSSPFDWMPLDLMASDGSAGNDPNARKPARFQADGPLLAAARRAKGTYTRGRVVEGVIGSSDVWNDEVDRVAWFHTTFGTMVEEMETASAAQIASLFDVPFLGIRVVSDNIRNGGAYDPNTGEACEDYVYQVVKSYVANTVKR